MPPRLARASDRARRTWQTVLLSLSGEFIPCPAAIVFILRLNFGKLTLGLTLVFALSLGLAATRVAIGIVAAMELRAGSAGPPVAIRSRAQRRGFG